ncbi:MAG: hypothetical protein AAF335_03180 [Bacteroidota bacterium]
MKVEERYKKTKIDLSEVIEHFSLKERNMNINLGSTLFETYTIDSSKACYTITRFDPPVYKKSKDKGTLEEQYRYAVHFDKYNRYEDFYEYELNFYNKDDFQKFIKQAAIPPEDLEEKDKSYTDPKTNQESTTSSTTHLLMIALLAGLCLLAIKYIYKKEKHQKHAKS